MTCIIGLAQEGKVYMGADSAACDDWTARATRIPKLFRSGNFVIGYTTSFRMGQILQYSLSLPEYDQDVKSVTCFILTDFIDAVRDCLKGKGYSVIENNRESAGTFLIGYRGQLFHVTDEFDVTESEDGLDACGSGFPFALGAMKALEHLPPRERIMKSLKIAAYFSGTVVGPFQVLEV